MNDMWIFGILGCVTILVLIRVIAVIGYFRRNKHTSVSIEERWKAVADDEYCRPVRPPVKTAEDICQQIDKEIISEVVFKDKAISHDEVKDLYAELPHPIVNCSGVEQPVCAKHAVQTPPPSTTVPSSQLLSDVDVLTKVQEYPAEEAKQMISRMKLQKLEDLKLRLSGGQASVLAQNPTCCFQQIDKEDKVKVEVELPVVTFHTDTPIKAGTVVTFHKTTKEEVSLQFGFSKNIAFLHPFEGKTIKCAKLPSGVEIPEVEGKLWKIDGRDGEYTKVTQVDENEQNIN